MNLFDPFVWAIFLMLIGCALIAMEIFLPTGGIMGFLATAAIIAAVVMAFSYHGPLVGFSFVAIALVSVPVMIGLAFKYLPYTPIGKRILLSLPTEDEVLPQDDRKSLEGKIGVAKTPMLPSGAVVIDGHTWDAVSQGMAIDPGEQVIVVEVKSNRIVVRPAERSELSRGESSDDVLSRPLEELGLDELDEPLA